MLPRIFIQVVETWLVARLLRSALFHRGVEKVAQTAHRLRTGEAPEAPGGTAIDDPARQDFLRHFTDELKSQFNGTVERQQAPRRHAPAEETREGSSVPEVEDAEAAWRRMQVRASEAPKGAEAREVRDEAENADVAWRNAQDGRSGGRVEKRSFFGEYAEAVREQMNNKKPGS